MKIDVKFVDVDIRETSSGRWCQVSIAGFYMGEFEFAGYYDDESDVAFYITDQIFAPAFEAARQKYGVTDDSE